MKRRPTEDDKSVLQDRNEVKETLLTSNVAIYFNLKHATSKIRGRVE